VARGALTALAEETLQAGSGGGQVTPAWVGSTFKQIF
jgi:hypothetical protein